MPFLNTNLDAYAKSLLNFEFLKGCKKMDEFLDNVFYVTRCCQLIEEKSQLGKAKNWKNSDFIKLSERVSEASKISISADTLKRLYGKVKTHRYYNPQIETKNALAIFLNYKNWEDFKKHYSQQSEIKSDIIVRPDFQSVERLEPRLVSKNVNVRNANIKIIIILISVSVLILALLPMFWPVREHKGNENSVSPKILFTAKNIKLQGRGTVLFNYDISEAGSDSVLIDYGFSHFGYREVDYLSKTLHTITHYYNFPGFYTAKIMDREKELGTLQIEVSSNGWEYGVYTNDNQLVGLDSNEFINSLTEGRAYVSPKTLKAKRLTSNWLEITNIRDFKVNDDFTLETRFKNSYNEGGTNCLETILRILGQKNQVRLQFNKQGCERWGILQFGEIVVDGKYSDLSMFNTTLVDWNDMKVEVRDKKAKIYLNGALIYTASYIDSLGSINGIIFNFRGTGSIDFVKLFDKQGHIVFNEEFNMQGK